MLALATIDCLARCDFASEHENHTMFSICTELRKKENIKKIINELVCSSMSELLFSVFVTHLSPIFLDVIIARVL